MPRKARKLSESGIYHIVMRGINRQNIFEDDKDCTKFLDTINEYKEKCDYEIYAYCLMGNHVHLLLKINNEPLDQVMRRVCGSYVYWYNQKYQRVGNLFQDRFRSEPVESDKYLLTVQRYIHQNPIKAGLARRIEDYKWSSYIEYLTKPNLVNTDFLLQIFATDPKKANESFIEYNRREHQEVCLDLESRRFVTDEEARNIIREIYRIRHPIDLQNLEKTNRNSILKELKAKHNLSVRQIERLTGINRGIITRA